MKRKFLGVSVLAWIIAIAIVLLFVSMLFVCDIVFYIVMGALGLSLVLFLIYLIAMWIDCLIN